MSDISATAYQLAVEYLLKNQTPHGMAAARPGDGMEKVTYASLFPRDIGVSTLGMLASDNEELIQLAKKSLESLVSSQSKRGQFPQNYVPEKHEVHWWIPGTIDGTLWWGIAFLKYYQKTGDKEFYEKYKENLDKAFVWLRYQDTNNDHLIEQGESAGWDDEMPRFGVVLYSNALWYWLITLRMEVEGLKLEHLKERIYDGVNSLLWIYKGDDRGENYFPDNSYTREVVYAKSMMEITNTKAVYLPYYLGYLSHKTFEMRCEVFGNILACLVGLADDRKRELFIDFVIRSGVNKPYPLKVLYPPIYPGEPDWRDYMAKGRQNYPWQYHNAGIWPFIGGFWVMLLNLHNKEAAEKELDNLAEANKLGRTEWEFNEYLHGQLGTPLGICYQSWNMAMYIAAYKAVNG